MAEASTSYRVVYVGTGRQPRRRFLGFLRPVGVFEPERDWRQRLAQEMETACQEMARRGLRLVDVVPALSSESLKGSWTEGVWLYFEHSA